MKPEYKKFWLDYLLIVIALGVFWLVFDILYQMRIEQGASKLINIYARRAAALGSGEFLQPHFGLLFLVNLVQAFFETSWDQSIKYVLCFHKVLAVIAAYHLLGALLDRPVRPLSQFVVAFFSFFVATLMVPWVPPKVYLGSRDIMIGNPTYTAAVPFAIMAFMYLYQMMRDWQKDHVCNPRVFLFFGAALFLTTAMKPGFTLTILPAFGVLLLLIPSLRHIRLYVSIFLAALPSALMMGSQYYFAAVDNPLGNKAVKLGRIMIDPLKVWSANVKDPLLAFSLTMVFPVVMLAFRWRQLSVITWLAVVNMVFATAYWALLRETFFVGDHRNFEWGYLHGLQLLFLCMMAEWVAWKRQAANLSWGWVERWRVVDLAGIVLIWHIISGLIKFFRKLPA